MAEATGSQRLLRRLAGRLYQPRTLLGLALLAGMLIATPQLMRLTRQLREQPEYQVDASDIRLSPPPPHVPREMLTDALTRAELGDRFSKLEPNIATRLHDALASDPWVEEVVRVTVDRTGVSLQLRYRSPALAVETDRGRFLVSADGVLLPSAAAVRLDLDALPRLTGTRRAPVSPAGQRWRNREVVAAAELVAELTASGDVWSRSDLVSLREAGPSQWELAAGNGSVVYWGAAGDVVTEPSTEQKRQRLEKVLTQYGSLTDGQGACRVDLTRWDMIAMEPIAYR